MFLVKKKVHAGGVSVISLFSAYKHQNLNSMASMKTKGAVLAGCPSRKFHDWGQLNLHDTGLVLMCSVHKKASLRPWNRVSRTVYYIGMPSFIRIIWKNTSTASGSNTIHGLCTLLPASGSCDRWSPHCLLSLRPCLAGLHARFHDRLR